MQASAANGACCVLPRGGSAAAGTALPADPSLPPLPPAGWLMVAVFYHLPSLESMGTLDGWGGSGRGGGCSGVRQPMMHGWGRVWCTTGVAAGPPSCTHTLSHPPTHPRRHQHQGGCGHVAGLLPGLTLHTGPAARPVWAAGGAARARPPPVQVRISWWRAVGRPGWVQGVMAGTQAGRGLWRTAAEGCQTGSAAGTACHSHALTHPATRTPLSVL